MFTLDEADLNDDNKKDKNRNLYRFTEEIKYQNDLQ